MIPPAITVPSIAADLSIRNLGNPFANSQILSDGQGSNGGIGNGKSGGVGSGGDDGLGPGKGGGFGGDIHGGVYRIGSGVSAPRLVFKVEPEYSEEARKARWQGTVVLSVIVDKAGRPRNINVVSPQGMGLDEKAIEAVQKWMFRPATLNGTPVAVVATIEVNFRLL
jgi:TonB family protein